MNIPQNPNGSATSANSQPVVIASDQVAVSVKQATGTNLHTVIDSSALPTGASTETTLATRLSESDFDTKTGSLTETAPATDTASSGLNGRLQRVAQRLTSLIALLPTALGTGGGLKVDGSGTALPISGTVTANAGTNLNTSALALDATLSTTNTEIGATNETAPASDTATSGLNGRLQRIAQRITSLITAIGSPFQAGGSIGNTSFAATQATGTNLHTVVDSGAITATLAAETTKVIGTVNQGTSPWVVSGTVMTATTDIAPATQNITVVDSASSTATGANNQTIIIGTPTAGSAASFTLSSIETIRVEVTGIWTGTIATETSIDGGTTWVNQGVHQGAYTTSSFTLGFVGGCNVAGATNFRVRATAAITGTAVVKITESINTQSVYIANAAPAGNVISVSNSSSATLTSGSVFTGISEDVSNFSEMRITVFSDVASATDGLSVQQSSNGTNWDITDVYTVSLSAAGAGKTYVVPRSAKFFRIVYTNGGTNQTTFRLQTILNRTATAPSSQRASDAYTNETDLVQNQAFSMLYNGTTWDRVRGDITNGLDVDVTRLPTLVAGTAIIGKVGIDQTTPGTTNGVQTLTGSTTAVTGNVTVVQGTGTNLHVVVDTAPSTAVTNAGTFAVQATVAAGATNIAKAEDIASADGDVGVPALAVRKATPANTSGTDGDYEFLQISAGRLWASATIDAALPAGANAIGKLAANSGVTIGAVEIAASQTLATVTTVGTVTTVSTVSALGASTTGPMKAEDAASATGDQGVAAMVRRKDTPVAAAQVNADEDYLTPITDNFGALWVAQLPKPNGGLTIATGTIAATKTDIGTANTAGQVYGWYFYNPNASVAYVQFFNAQASAVTLGTTAPVYSLGIPATSGANVFLPHGITHATAISIAVTTTRSGSSGPGSTVDFNIFFKQ